MFIPFAYQTSSTVPYYTKSLDGDYIGRIGTDYIVHAYLTTGTSSFTPTANINAYVVTVGGGGGGGVRRGGGGGGLLEKYILLESGSTYEVIVGNGAPYIGHSTQEPGKNGESSVFDIYEAFGGGGGGAGLYGGVIGLNGGCGGGSGYDSVNTSSAGGTGSIGYNGGEFPNTSTNYAAGGGGMGNSGSDSTTSNPLGGIGLDYTQWLRGRLGDDGWFASGGTGGGSTSLLESTKGGGGAGGRGYDGARGDEPERNGKPNTGGGGGGAGQRTITTSGGTGGSGIVFIVYRNQNEVEENFVESTDTLDDINNGLLDYTLGLSLKQLKGGPGYHIIYCVRDYDEAEKGFTQYELENGDVQDWSLSGSVYIRTWYDQINDYDFYQTLRTKQPVVVSSGSQIYSNEGHPMIYFGTGRQLVTSTTQFVLASNQTIYNTFLVAQKGSNGSIMTGNGFSGYQYFGYDDNVTVQFRANAGASSDFTVPYGPTSSHTMYYVSQNNTGSYYHDTVYTGTEIVNGTGYLEVIGDNNANSATSYVGELLMYRGDLTNYSSSIMNLQATRFGI